MGEGVITLTLSTPLDIYGFFPDKTVFNIKVWYTFYINYLAIYCATTNIKATGLRPLVSNFVFIIISSKRL